MTGLTATNAFLKRNGDACAVLPAGVAVFAGSEIAFTPPSKEWLLQAAVVLPVRDSTQMA